MTATFARSARFVGSGIVIGVFVGLAGVAVAQAPGDEPPQNPPPGEPSWLPGVHDVTAQEIATPGKVTLSMQRAVELAQKQNPNVRIQQATYDAALGRVDQARVPLQPTLQLSASASVVSNNCFGVSTGTGSGMGVGITTTTCGFFTTQYSTPLLATGRWTIWDFGLTRANTRAAQLNAEAQKATIGTTGLDTRQSVELAYLNAIAQHRLVIVAQATVTSETGHLDQAKRFVAAGAQDPIAVAQAQARYANAKSALAQAQSNEQTALASLRAAIGYIDPTRQIEIDPSWPVPSQDEPPALPALVEQANTHRPEIIALQKGIEAAQASLDAAHYERRPTLSALVTAGWTPSSSNWSPQPSYTAALTLSWFAWDGGKSRADVHVAHANMLVAQAQLDQLKVTLTSSLESARAQIITQRAAVAASNEAVASARQQLKLSEGRYAQNIASQIELADAQTAVTTAEGNLVSAEWQLANAWTSLQRQIGQ